MWGNVAILCFLETPMAADNADLLFQTSVDTRVFQRCSFDGKETCTQVFTQYTV